MMEGVIFQGYYTDFLISFLDISILLGFDQPFTSFSFYYELTSYVMKSLYSIPSRRSGHCQVPIYQLDYIP